MLEWMVADFLSVKYNKDWFTPSSQPRLKMFFWIWCNWTPSASPSIVSGDRKALNRFGTEIPMIRYAQLRPVVRISVYVDDSFADRCNLIDRTPSWSWIRRQRPTILAEDKSKQARAPCREPKKKIFRSRSGRKVVTSNPDGIWIKLVETRQMPGGEVFRSAKLDECSKVEMVVWWIPWARTKKDEL